MVTFNFARVRALCCLMDINISTLANRTGCSAGYVYQQLYGTRTVTQALLDELERSFGAAGMAWVTERIHVLELPPPAPTESTP